MSVEQVGPGKVSNSYGVRTTKSKLVYDNTDSYQDVFIPTGSVPVTATPSAKGLRIQGPNGDVTSELPRPLGATALPAEYDLRTVSTLSRVAQVQGVRECGMCWHPGKSLWYAVSDCIDKSGNPAWPEVGTNKSLVLWSSPDLVTWTYIGVAVPSHDNGLASPAGLACIDNVLYVAYSVRTTTDGSSYKIGLSASTTNPATIPWAEVGMFPSVGVDDDAAVVADPVVPGRLHLFHRTMDYGVTGSYRIVRRQSDTPSKIESWSDAVEVIPRTLYPVDKRELTSAIFHNGAYHIVTEDQNSGLYYGTAHWVSATPSGPFAPCERGLYMTANEKLTALGGWTNGHITYAVRDGEIRAAFVIKSLSGDVYGLVGSFVRPRTGWRDFVLAIPNATPSLAAATWLTIPYLSSVAGSVDPGGTMNTIAGRFVAPAAGWYRFSLSIGMQGIIPAGTLTMARVNIPNKSVYDSFLSTRQGGASADVWRVSGTSKPYYMDAGDYADFQAYADAVSGTVTLTNNAGFSWVTVEPMGRIGLP